MSEPWKAEREWTVHEVRDVVRSHCPELSAHTVEPMGSGWDNAAFVIDRELIFRFVRRKFAESLLEREWDVLPRLAPRISVPIPYPQWFGRVDGWPFIGYRMLHGRPASDVNMDKPSRAVLATPLGRFLRQLHDQPVQDLSVEPDSLGRFDLPRRRERAIQMLSECDSTIDIHSLQRGLDDVDVTPEPHVLSHGDLYSRHLLIQNGQLSGVIDWGDVCLAEPAHDLMVAFCFLPRDARSGFFDEYGDVSSRTISRARFRAICHALHVYQYAKTTSDTALFAEATTSLQWIMSR